MDKIPWGWVALGGTILFLISVTISLAIGVWIDIDDGKK